MADDKDCPLGAVGLAVVRGGLLGAAMAMLLAPQSGHRTREQLRGYARRAQEKIHDLADMPIQILDDTMDKGHAFITDQQAVISDANRGRACGHATGT